MTTTSLRISLSIALLCGAATAGASSVSVAPGGNTTFVGTAVFYVRPPAGVNAEITRCTMTLQTTLTPATTAVTVNDMQTANCTNDYFVGPYGVPWHGVTQFFSMGDWETIMNDTQLELIDGGPLGPPASFSCINSLRWNFLWVADYVTSPTISQVKTDYQRQFAKTPGGHVCAVDFTLYLSPYQTLTLHP